MLSQSVFTISFRYTHLGLQERQAKESCLRLYSCLQSDFWSYVQEQRSPGPDCVTTWPRSALPSNAPDMLPMATSHYCSSALAIQHALLILGAGKGFSELIIPDQMEQDLVYCKQDLFTKAIIRFICLSRFCIFTDIFLYIYLYLNKLMFWSGCN